MQKEINFLKDELKRKDEIIKVITDEQKLHETAQPHTKTIHPTIRTPTSVKKTITISGDSITKDSKPQKLRKKLNKHDNIFVMSFPGATTSQMVHYAKPSLEYEPNLIILHCRTYDLRGEKEPGEIANIITLCNSIKITSLYAYVQITILPSVTNFFNLVLIVLHIVLCL